MTKKIAIIHPDLGIGGAEQLVVNIALCLQSCGHNVTIFTPYHDPARSFPPTHDGTLQVQVRGLFPRSFFGKCVAFCTVMRMLLCSLHVLLYAGKYDAIILDQVSAILPVFSIFPYKLIFYCHFPDKLLCPSRDSAVKKVYRLFLDMGEEHGMSYAHSVLVNSNFTKGVVKEAFPSLRHNKVEVLYPGVDLEYSCARTPPEFLSGAQFLFTLNRYERKKEIEVALRTYSEIKTNQLKLLVGGGYDTRLYENVKYLEDLRGLCEGLGLSHCLVEDWANTPVADVYFTTNLTETQKEQALQHCACLLYTPQNEHFGIVPVEAMARGIPVVAWASGGPQESVLHLETGFLANSESAWVQGVQFVLNSLDRKRACEQGKLRVFQHFSLNRMSEHLSKLVS